MVGPGGTHAGAGGLRWSIFYTVSSFKGHPLVRLGYSSDGTAADKLCCQQAGVTTGPGRKILEMLTPGGGGGGGGSSGKSGPYCGRNWMQRGRMETATRCQISLRK